MNLMSRTHFSIMYVILEIDEIQNNFKKPVFKFVKKSLAYSFAECLQSQQNDQNRSHD